MYSSNANWQLDALLSIFTPQFMLIWRQPLMPLPHKLELRRGDASSFQWSQWHPLGAHTYVHAHAHKEDDWQQSISGLLTVPLDDAILCNNCKSMRWHVKNGNGAFVCHVYYYNIPILFYACNSSVYPYGCVCVCVSVWVCVCVCLPYTFCDCVCSFVINLMINRLRKIYWVFAWHCQAASCGIVRQRAAAATTNHWIEATNFRNCYPSITCHNCEVPFQSKTLLGPLRFMQKLPNFSK